MSHLASSSPGCDPSDLIPTNVGRKCRFWGGSILEKMHFEEKSYKRIAKGDGRKVLQTKKKGNEPFAPQDGLWPNDAILPEDFAFAASEIA